VREPERELVDPGGPDDDEGDDPFGDEEDVLASPAAAAPSRPAARPEGSNSLGGNKCSIDGCPATLTAGQVAMSTQKFGKPLCPIHQREAVPVGAAAAPSGNGAGRRPAGKGASSGGDTLL